MIKRTVLRFPILFFGIFSLLTGLWAGLKRIGIDLPFFNESINMFHGPIMINGFLGTVIGLERATAYGKKWVYTMPILAALSSIFLIFNIDVSISIFLASASGLMMVFVFVIFLKKKFDLFNFVIAFGAVYWLWGNINWYLTHDLSIATSFWLAFLLFTIAGERIELAKLTMIDKKKQKWFLSFLLLFFIASLLRFYNLHLFYTVIGISLSGIAFWLLKYDIARKTIRFDALPKFIAVNLLTAYAWLILTAVFFIFSSFSTAVFLNDAVLHSFFLGFVISMIFGHAPVIFPAVLGVKMEFSNRFYIHYFILLLTLILRIFADLTISVELRELAAILNALSILVFLVNTVSSIRRG